MCNDYINKAANSAAELIREGTYPPHAIQMTAKNYDVESKLIARELNRRAQARRKLNKCKKYRLVRA